MVDPKKRVQVYFNLHKRVWSVRQSGLVVEQPVVEGIWN